MPETNLLALLSKFSRMGIIRGLEEVVLEQGSPARIWLGSTPLYLAADPASLQYLLRDNIKNYRKPDLYYNAAKITLGNGLITSEGETWLRQRRMIQPYLHRKALTGISQTISETISKIFDSWQGIEGQIQDAGSLMAELSMAIIMNTLFGTDVLSAREREEVAQSVKVIVDYTATRGYMMFWPKDWPIIGEKRFQAAYQTVYNAIARLIAVRREQGAEQDNLIGMLLHSVDEESQHQMSEKQLFDEAMTMFLAGYESTTTALSWFWYLLGENPQIYQALQDEIDGVLGGNSPQIEQYSALNLCQMAYLENLRLYPPSPFVPREAVEDDQIGGVNIRKGEFVFAFFYGVHRNPEIWNEPERFDPYRFSPDQEAGRSRFAFVPFSAGQRQCVGSDFALLTAIWIIAMTMQRYQVHLVEGQTIIPRVRATLHPAHGVKIILRRR